RMMTTTAPEATLKAGGYATLPMTLTARPDRPWMNWARTVGCLPALSCYPRSTDDLCQIVRFAHGAGRRVRAVGAGHSWSALVPTTDILVYMAGLDDVVMDLRNPAQPRVIVGGGATVRQVNAVLERHGYALPLNVVLESVRFGGLVATGSHGSGWNNQTLSDLVHAIEIVDATGTLRRFEVGVATPEVLSAARMHLGMFGLTATITLNVQPTWNVRARDRLVPPAEVLPNLKQWVLAHENLDLFWWPFCERLWVKSWDRSAKPATARPRHNRVDAAWAWTTSQMHRGALGLCRAVPPLTPAICRGLLPFTPSNGDRIVPIVEAIHYRRAIEVARMGCLEVAFKLDPDFANARWAIEVALGRVQAYAAKGQYPLNVTLNARFIHNSDCLLSPAYGPGHTCYIEILGAGDPALWQRFSGEVACDWLQLPQALPHWAKQYRHIPGILEHMRAGLGSNIARFNQIKAELGVDPEGMFLNDGLRELFA
ncbi:MAG: FAD-binding protein, partial [Oscillochloridaceae bacterium umkhey_bin13]